MHLHASTSALLFCYLLSIFLGASAELIPRDLDILPRQAGSSSSTSASPAAASGKATGGGEDGSEGGSEGGASDAANTAANVGASSAMTSASSKAAAAPRATGEVHAKALAVGAAGLIVGML